MIGKARRENFRVAPQSRFDLPTERPTESAKQQSGYDDCIFMNRAEKACGQICLRERRACSLPPRRWLSNCHNGADVARVVKSKRGAPHAVSTVPVTPANTCTRCRMEWAASSARWQDGIQSKECASGRTLRATNQLTFTFLFVFVPLLSHLSFDDVLNQRPFFYK